MDISVPFGMCQCAQTNIYQRFINNSGYARYHLFHYRLHAHTIMRFNILAIVYRASVHTVKATRTTAYARNSTLQVLSAPTWLMVHYRIYCVISLWGHTLQPSHVLLRTYSTYAYRVAS